MHAGVFQHITFISLAYKKWVAGESFKKGVAENGKHFLGDRGSFSIKLGLYKRTLLQGL
jgi:hypothetical protein